MSTNTTPEVMDESLGPITDSLQAIDPADASQRLDELAASGEVDPLAGIYIVPLVEVKPVDHDGQTFRFYIARVMPGKHVNPHLHNGGAEPYHFLSGDGGQLNLGGVSDGAVDWEEPKTVVPGETSVVAESQVHSFVNLGKEPFDFAFACPDSHLTDKSVENPRGDRYFTADLENGLPPSLTSET
jgi:mannose-6-phosphate isomerase-like protein (cupin superfamily)